MIYFLTNWGTNMSEKTNNRGGKKTTSTLLTEFLAAKALYTAARAELGKRLPECLTQEQFVILSMLRGGPVYADDLAERSGMLSPSVSRILGDLEGRDAITRLECKTDARRRLVSITDDGKMILREVK